MNTTTTAASRNPVTHWETTLFSSAPAASGRTTGRVSARAAFQEVLYGRAVLVDIRPAIQRAAEGEVAASLAPLVVERNVLEWRFDPRHEARLPQAGLETRVIVLCQQGYASSLAADALVRLGIRRATDVVGGFAAWRSAGLPVSLLPSRR